MLQKLILALACCLTLTATACNTVKGAGNDIQKAGTAIEKAADKNK
jgi:predicted small secreted protein